MPADDTIKPAVVTALQKDGWTITHDPYTLRYGTDRLLVDLAAAKALVGAERGEERIAIEIKSFVSPSLLNEFQTALGQFMVYAMLLREVDPERRLVVAVSEVAYQNLIAKPMVEFVLQKQPIPFVVVRLSTEEVVSWTN